MGRQVLVCAAHHAFADTLHGWGSCVCVAAQRKQHHTRVAVVRLDHCRAPCASRTHVAERPVHRERAYRCTRWCESRGLSELPPMIFLALAFLMLSVSGGHVLS